MADRVTHLAHLPVASFVNDEREERLRAALRLDDPGELHSGGRGAAAGERDPFREPLELVLVGHAPDAHLVLALDTVAGVGQPGSQIAVARQDEEPFGIVVQPSDRVYVFADATAGEQIHDGRAVLRIGAARDVSTRLVQEQIATPRRALDAAPVHANVVSGGIRLRAELADGHTVDRDPPLLDERLGRAARCHAGRREDLLQTCFHRFFPPRPPLITADHIRWRAMCPPGGHSRNNQGLTPAWPGDSVDRIVLRGSRVRGAVRSVRRVGLLRRPHVGRCGPLFPSRAIFG
jgi:hypothetical protein